MDEIWAAEDATVYGANIPYKKYVKCCSQYNEAISCPSYSQANIDFCSNFTTEETCFQQATGFRLQADYGYGNLLTKFREGCFEDEVECEMITVQDWSPRDQCVWCPNQQQCRPGSNYGICFPQKISFTTTFNLQCSPETACSLVAAYPDLAPYITEPFQNPSAQQITNAPTFSEINCSGFRKRKECMQYPVNCLWQNKVCNQVPFG